MTKKILLYTDTPQVGGAELQMFLIAKFLDKSECEPILVCSHYPALDKWCENFEKEQIPVIRLKVWHKHDPRHYSYLRKIIKKHSPALLHAHIWNPASSRYAYLAARDSTLPLIITEHDPFALHGLKNLLKKRLLTLADKIITVSKSNLKTLKTLYPQHADKMTVIHNGIDTTWWHSQLLRCTPQDNKDTLTLVTIAELHERKGLKYLLEALAIIVKDHAQIKSVIIGEGPERGALERQIKKLTLEDHVMLLGRRKDIPQLLRSSDIFVLPSRREAFGLVNAEAMITGLPVVATKVGGIPEIVDDKKTGILVPSEDSPALAAALTTLIANPALRQKYGAAGKNRVLEHFDARVMTEKYEAVYRDTLDR